MITSAWIFSPNFIFNISKWFETLNPKPFQHQCSSSIFMKRVFSPGFRTFHDFHQRFWFLSTQNQAGLCGRIPYFPVCSRIRSHHMLFLASSWFGSSQMRPWFLKSSWSLLVGFLHRHQSGSWWSLNAISLEIGCLPLRFLNNMQDFCGALP